MVKTYVTPVIIGLMTWIIRETVKRSIAKATEIYHQFLTENANRIRDEVIIYVDKKFTEHEKTEVECIKALQNTVGILEKLAGIIKEKKE